MNKDIFKVFPEFETKRLKIRAFALDDYNKYVAWNGGDVPYYMDGLHYIAEGNIEGYKRLFLKNNSYMRKQMSKILYRRLRLLSI